MVSLCRILPMPVCDEPGIRKCRLIEQDDNIPFLNNGGKVYVIGMVVVDLSPEIWQFISLYFPGFHHYLCIRI